MSRKCVLYIAASLDGFIADEYGGVAWLDEAEGDGGDNGYSEFYKTIDTIIMGKTTYDQVLGFGDWMYKGKKCYVYSRKEKGRTEFAEFIDEDPAAFLQKLKDQEGADIWLEGGAILADEFIKKNLVDEYIITIIPVILGRGIPLFLGNNPKIRLKLKKMVQIGQMAQLYYEPER